MLNYHHLRYFWAVANEGSLTRAARHLRVSQSSLSVQIQKLEAQLGHPLFERVGKGLVLTEAGRVALDFADSIFQTGDELLQTMQGVGDPMRVFRVGALATLSRNFQIGFVGQLLEREDVEVVIRSGTLAELLGALDAHRLDVVLSNVVPVRDAATLWVPHAIDEQPVSLVGHRKHGRRKKRDVRAWLATEPVVLPTPQSSIRTGFDALCDRLRVRPRVAAEVDDMAMLRLVAREHAGLAVVPPIVVKDELDTGVLVELAQLPELAETFFAITLPRRFPNPLLDVVLDSRSE